MDRQYIGVDIGGTSVKLGIVDEEGSVLARREVEYQGTNGAGGTHTVMETIADSIGKLVDDSGGIDLFSGIGVSAAGCINSVKGCVAKNGGNVKGWAHTEVCSILHEKFGIPVTLANDANCAVLGELWTGAAKGYTDVLGITVGTGIGGGVITGGRLLEGSHGFGGELGHFTTHAGGERCVCGQSGCYERYASTSALVRSAIEEDPELSNGRKIFAAAESGETHAVRVLDKWITEIAYGLTGFVHVFDPQLILIGGGVSAQEDLLVKPLREKILELVQPDFADGLEIKAAELGNNAGMAGAVKYFIDSMARKES